MRTVLVLPFVPVTATTGILAGVPGGYSRSMIAPATSRGVPSDGDRCIRSPGHALSSITAPPRAAGRPGAPGGGAVMSASRMSMPQMSRPQTAAARRHISATSPGSRSVTSRLVPPVDRLAFLPQRHGLPGRHGAGPQPAAGQVADGRVVQRDPGQLAGVAVTAPGIGIGLVDELPDGAGAIAGDRGRPELGGGHHPAVDDEYAVVQAGDERLHDHRRVRGAGLRVGRLGRGRCGDADGDTGAVASVSRLDHYWSAEQLEQPGRLPRAARDPSAGHRECRPRPAAAWPAPCRRRCPPRRPRSGRSAPRRPAAGAGRSRAGACCGCRSAGPGCRGGGRRGLSRPCSRRGSRLPPSG